MNDGHAVLISGPEDGLTVRVGGISPPPRKIDIDTGDGRVARYVRVTRLAFDPNRSRGCAATGQLSYRFRGYAVAEGVA